MLVDALFNSAFCLLYPDYSDKQINMYDSLLKGDSILREIDALGCCEDNLLVAIEFLRFGANNDSTNFCSLFMALAYKELDIEKAYSLFEYIAYNNQKNDYRNKAWALRNLAQIEAYTKSDEEKAVEYFEEVLCIDNTYYFDHYQIAQLKDMLGYSKEEIEFSYQQIVLCDPNNIDAYIIRAESLDDFQQAIRLSEGENNAYVYSARARYKAKNNDLIGALEDYTIAIGLDSDNYLRYRHRADFKNYKLNDFAGAVLDYDHAIAIEKNDSLLFSNRASLKIKLKQFEGAITDFDIAIKLCPMDKHLYTYKANVYEKIAAWDNALACYTMSIIIDPSSKYSYIKRAAVYEKLHRYVDAKKDIEISKRL